MCFYLQCLISYIHIQDLFYCPIKTRLAAEFKLKGLFCPIISGPHKPWRGRIRDRISERTSTGWPHVAWCCYYKERLRHHAPSRHNTRHQVSTLKRGHQAFSFFFKCEVKKKLKNGIKMNSKKHFAVIAVWLDNLRSTEDAISVSFCELYGVVQKTEQPFAEEKKNKLLRDCWTVWLMRFGRWREVICLVDQEVK